MALWHCLVTLRYQSGITSLLPPWLLFGMPRLLFDLLCFTLAPLHPKACTTRFSDTSSSPHSLRYTPAQLLTHRASVKRLQRPGGGGEGGWGGWSDEGDTSLVNVVQVLFGFDFNAGLVVKLY